MIEYDHALVKKDEQELYTESFHQAINLMDKMAEESKSCSELHGYIVKVSDLVLETNGKINNIHNDFRNKLEKLQN